jgi:hypothetical protein
MKKPPVLVIIIAVCVILGVLSLVANSFRNRISQKIGDKFAEKVIETQTGGKVKIDSNGNDVTVKTADGQVQYSTGGGVTLPDGFPKELIVADDAKVVMATSSGTGNSVTYLTNDAQDTVFAKYLTNLSAAGWTKDTEVNSTEGKWVNFTKGTESVLISIANNSSSDQAEKTTVSVVWTNDTNK